MDITDNLPPSYRIETTQLALLKTYFPISTWEKPEEIIQKLLKKHEKPFLDILNYLKVDIIKLKNIRTRNN